MTGGRLVPGMPVLTLRQPWASLIAVGVKTIETRSWPAPESLIGERIAIHAAARDTDRDLSIPEECWDALGRCIGGAAPPRGAVVATARLVDCVPMVCDDNDGAYFDPGPDLDPGQAHLKLVNGRAIHWWWDDEGDRWDMAVQDDQLPYGDFRPGRWAWLLDDVERLAEPVPARGRQRIWRWQP